MWECARSCPEDGMQVQVYDTVERMHKSRLVSTSGVRSRSLVVELQYARAQSRDRPRQPPQRTLRLRTVTAQEVLKCLKTGQHGGRSQSVTLSELFDPRLPDASRVGGSHGRCRWDTEVRHQGSSRQFRRPELQPKLRYHRSPRIPSNAPHRLPPRGPRKSIRV